MSRRTRTPRALLALAVILGLLLPRMGAALAEAAGLDHVVICRGDVLVSLTLDADGAPVETALRDHGPCLAAALPRPPDPPAPSWIRLAFPPAQRPSEGGPPPPATIWIGPPPERGPPVGMA